MEIKHRGVDHCDQCDYAALTLGDLKRHKESKHEGIRYPCDQCDYVTNNVGARRSSMRVFGTPVINVISLQKH